MNQFVDTKAKVDSMLKKLRTYSMPLQERELAILAATIVEIQNAYSDLDPLKTPIVIQVDTQSVLLWWL